jgi:elongation factor P
MINVTDLKGGTFFLHSDGDPYKAISYDHIKMGRGGAVIKVKAKNILTGAIKEISFNNGDRLKEADMENRNFQYLYKNGDHLNFMDLEDYSQVEIPIEDLEWESRFLIENRDYQLLMFNGKAISIVLPASMIYKVTEAFDAEKGNTSKSATKEITLENGLKVHAPMFIKVGDTVKVNTESGEYISRFN